MQPRIEVLTHQRNYRSFEIYPDAGTEFICQYMQCIWQGFKLCYLQSGFVENVWTRELNVMKRNLFDCASSSTNLLSPSHFNTPLYSFSLGFGKMCELKLLIDAISVFSIHFALFLCFISLNMQTTSIRYRN